MLDTVIGPAPFCSVPQAAGLAFPDGSVQSEHLHLEIEKGVLPAARVDGHLFVSLAAVNAWSQSLRHTRRERFGFVYFVGFLQYVKIGFSEDVPLRISSLQTAVPLKLRLHFEFPGTLSQEREIHKTFDELRLEGEWFLFDRRIRHWIGQKRQLLSGRDLRWSTRRQAREGRHEAS